MFNQKLKQEVAIAMGALVIAALAGCSRGTAPAAQPSTQAQTHGSAGSGHDASAQAQASGGAQAGPATAGSQGAAQPAGQRFRIIGDQSKAAYHVDETFLQRQQFNTAVGRTQAIEGELLLDMEKGLVLPSSVRVDLSTLKSDQDRRDRAVQRTLGVAEFRYATFHIESVSGTPTFRPGQEETFTLSGTMELRGGEEARRLRGPIPPRRRGAQLDRLHQPEDDGFRDRTPERGRHRLRRGGGPDRGEDHRPAGKLSRPGRPQAAGPVRGGWRSRLPARPVAGAGRLAGRRRDGA